MWFDRGGSLGLTEGLTWMGWMSSGAFYECFFWFLGVGAVCPLFFFSFGGFGAGFGFVFPGVCCFFCCCLGSLWVPGLRESLACALLAFLCFCVVFCKFNHFSLVSQMY